MVGHLRKAGGMLAILAMIALAGCGGEDDSTDDTPAASQTATAPPEEIEVGPLDMSGDPSIRYRTGRHTNVPDFGKQADSAELRQAATDMHGYVVARVEKDWPAACAFVSDALVRRLATRAEPGTGGGCAAVLAAFPVSGTGGSDYESSTVEVEGLRVAGKRGYFLYAAATAPFFVPMVNEGGEWKVDALLGTSFYD